MRLNKSLVGVSALSALALSASSSAQQGLAAVGPTNPEHGFPEWYEDLGGLRLDACITDTTLCLLDTLPPVLIDPNLPFPDNFGGVWSDHTFFHMAEASMPTNNGGQALLVLTVQGGFLNDAGPVDGEQEVFTRFRVRVDNLIPGANYTVTTPYGVYNFIAQNAGVRGINFTEDAGRGVPGVFSGALGGEVGPFVMWDSDLPIVDAQGREYLGNPTIEHTITGSPFGTNFFRIDGPSVGGPGVNRVETDLFAVIGLKSAVVEPPPPAPVANFSSAPNSGVAPLNVAFTDASTGTITSWSWNFGDATSSTLQNPTHAYAAGTFSVSLTVTGPGGSNTLTKTNLVAVTEPPVANPLVLALPVPGSAGVPNSLTVTGATPGRVVGVYTGQVLGAAIVNQGNCGGIPIGIGRPFRLAGRAVANAAGTAVVPVSPPATSAGKLFHFQAVEPASCRTSNVVSDIL